MTTVSENLFLSALSAKTREALTTRVVPVPLPVLTQLYRAEEEPEFAYFLTSGIASVVTSVAEGGTAEVGLIGREGIVGAVHLLGPATVSTNCFIQMEGEGLRIPFADLKQAFRISAEVRDRVLECVQEQMLVLAQIAACNRLHGAEERLARWLLMARDRTHSDNLGLTQEFLAMMLGSRRTTVTMIAGALQQSGLIEYRRGRVKILDRESLEAAACDCYKIARQLYFNLYKRDGLPLKPT